MLICPSFREIVHSSEDVYRREIALLQHQIDQLKANQVGEVQSTRKDFEVQLSNLKLQLENQALLVQKERLETAQHVQQSTWCF